MNVAIFLPNWVGDAVMATPAIAALRRHYSQARFLGVLRPYVRGVIDGSPWFEQLILSQGKGWAESVAGVACRLRRARVDLAVLFTNSFRSAFIATLGGCRRIVGYARDRRSWMLTDPVPPLRDDAGRFLVAPVIDAYNTLAMYLGTNDPGYQMQLFLTPGDRQQAEALWDRLRLNGQRVVLLNPGAAYGAAKHWPTEHWIRLAQQLVDELQTRILVLCGPQERSLAQRIVASAARPGVHSLAEEPLSLGLTKACVHRGDLLITTDSGPRHFAAAFGRPVVTLFGPTHIGWTETYFPKAIHLQEEVDCGPCQLRTCPLDHRCMTQLQPTAVFHAASQLLAAASTASLTASQGRRALPMRRTRRGA
jgi:heptosyltransferase-2